MISPSTSRTQEEIMNKRKLILLLSSVFVCISANSSQAKNLAERHADRYTNCTACHKDGNPSNHPTSQDCFKCHGGYAQIIKKTASLDTNPHDTHLGEIECTSCHSGHAKPKLICTQYHGLTYSDELKTP